MLGRRLNQFRRYRHFIAVLGKYGFQEAADIVRGHLPVTFLPGWSRRWRKQGKAAPHRHTRAERVRLAFEEMGPMFTKLGQLLSTRPDLIPPDYIKQLELLQDRVPPLPGEKIVTALEKSLGGKLENFFADFSIEPLAAGSIAQVHQARLHDGTKVAVKVRRPEIVETIRAELGILHDLAGFLRILITGSEEIDLQQMVDEFSQAIQREADLNHERQNIKRFQLNYKDDPSVHIPLIYQDLCRDNVLVMEYIKGIRPGLAETIREAGLDPDRVAESSAKFALSQIFEHGLFHTDPHPGNLLIMPDNVLAPLDFGQVSRLGRSDLQLLNEIVVAIVDNDAELMLRALEHHEMLGEKTNERQLHSQLENMLADYYGLPIAEIPFNEMISETFDIIRNNHIRPPRQFTLMLKTMLIMENLAKNLNPDFNAVYHLKPYAQKYRLSALDPRNVARNFRNAVRGFSELATRLPEDTYSIIRKFRSGKFQMRIHHEHLNELSDTLNKSSSRISFALIVAALLVSSSMLVPQEGMLLRLITYQQLGIAGYIGAAIVGGGLVISMARGRHV